MIPRRHGSFAGNRRQRGFRFIILFALFSAFLLRASPAPRAPQQSNAAPFAASIVLPPKVIAGHPATLAALDSQGKLLPGAAIQIAAQPESQKESHHQTQTREFQSLTTGPTGRAVFTALTEAGIIIAKAPGVSAIALADVPRQSPSAPKLIVPPLVSLRDTFSVCGGDFHGDAEANRVQINGDPALVLAASPECIVVLAGPNMKPGPATVAIQTGAAKWTAATTLVSLAFEPPSPALTSSKKSRLTVHVEGSDQPLAIIVENKTPSVLRFLRGDIQELRTSGGASNAASVEVRTLRSGSFSFQARLVPQPDLEAARRYLAAAATLADRDLRRKIAAVAERLARHPGDLANIKRDLARILALTPEGDLRTTLAAARSSMGSV
jgi:hypothetical protein